MKRTLTATLAFQLFTALTIIGVFNLKRPPQHYFYVAIPTCHVPWRVAVKGPIAPFGSMIEGLGALPHTKSWNYTAITTPRTIGVITFNDGTPSLRLHTGQSIVLVCDDPPAHCPRERVLWFDTNEPGSCV